MPIDSLSEPCGRANNPRWGRHVLVSIRHRRCLLDSRPVVVWFWLALAAFATAAAQAAPSQSVAEPVRPVSYGMEVALRSSHADRGFVISDGPAVQPVMWVSGLGAYLSAWSSFTLAETPDGSRPQIVELELGREHEWSRLAITPAIRSYFYNDPLSRYSSRSIEGWLNLSYAAGPLRLFTDHSVDVLTYPGAYYGDAGIALEGRLSPDVELGASAGAGWASATFNDAWAGVPKAAFERVNVEGRLTSYVTPHFYIGPHFELSAILDRELRAALTRPTFLLVGVTTGIEF